MASLQDSGGSSLYVQYLATFPIDYQRFHDDIHQVIACARNYIMTRLLDEKVAWLAQLKYLSDISQNCSEPNVDSVDPEGGNGLATIPLLVLHQSKKVLENPYTNYSTTKQKSTYFLHEPRFVCQCSFAKGSLYPLQRNIYSQTHNPENLVILKIMVQTKN